MEGVIDEVAVMRSRKLLEKGLLAVSRGQHAEARDHFKASAEACATADAFTYWGWMEHHLGDTDHAITLCQKAIEIDPRFGNPYNDIGSYLISQGKFDEAIPWLEKAVGAERYEPRQFPHMNLGRVYVAKSMPVKALKEFRLALDYNPGNPELLEIITSLEQSLN